MAGLAYVLSAVGLSVVLINVSKHILHFPCPWQALNDWGHLSPINGGRMQPDVSPQATPAAAGLGCVCII